MDNVLEEMLCAQVQVVLEELPVLRQIHRALEEIAFAQEQVLQDQLQDDPLQELVRHSQEEVVEVVVEVSQGEVVEAVVAVEAFREVEAVVEEEDKNISL